MLTIGFPHRGWQRGFRPSGSSISMLTLAKHLTGLGVRSVLLLHCDANTQSDNFTGTFRPSPINWQEVRKDAVIEEAYTVESPFMGKEMPATRAQADIVADFAPAWQGAVRRLDIDLIHTNDAAMHCTWGELCRMLAIPHVWHERGLFRHNHRARKSLYRAKKILTISEFVRSLAPVPLRDRCTVIPNPIDAPTSVDYSEKRMTIRQELGLPQNALLFGMIANQNPRKRWSLFFDVASSFLSVNDTYRNLSYFLSIGIPKKFHEDALNAVLIPSSLREKIIRMGYRSDIYNVMAGLDAVIATAKDEPHGRVVVEAGILGVPVIASDSGGHNEILSNGSAISLVDPDSIEGFAEKCRSFAADPEPFRAAARVLQEPLRERHLPSTHAQRVAAEYEKVVRRRSGNRFFAGFRRIFGVRA